MTPAPRIDAEAALGRARERGFTLRAPLVVVAVTGSTQDDARAAAALGAPAGSTHVAGEQTRGRGRQGRSWVAPPGSALLASVLLRPDLPLARLPPLSLVVGLALCDALEERLAPGRVAIKWPNDLLACGRKVAGVLIETSLRGDRAEAVIVGFGVNLLRASLPGDLRARAISLEEAGATDLDPARLLGDILARLEGRVGEYQACGLGALLPALRARDATRGRRVKSDELSGTAEGIADDGRLLVRTAAGLVSVSAGEVVFEPDPR